MVRSRAGADRSQLTDLAIAGPQGPWLRMRATVAAFDYVVVGAGSVGAPLAARLSVDPAVTAVFAPSR